MENFKLRFLVLCSLCFFLSLAFLNSGAWMFNYAVVSRNIHSLPVKELPENPCSSKVAYATLMANPPPFGSEPHFQKFGDLGGVYSAYYDAREPLKRAVRILGVMDNQTETFCHVISRSAEGNLEMLVLKAVFSGRIPWERSSNYIMATCALREDFAVPVQVALSYDKCGDPIASLPVLNTYRRSPQYNFTVCLHQPLFNLTMEDVPRILEWIAVNRVFGGEHFVIYTLPSTEIIGEYLQPLVAIGLVEIHVWDVDYARTDNQRAIVNECIYRHMYTSNRIALMDIDEFPTPHSAENWSELIRHSPCANSSAAYFRNAFFPLQFNDDSPSTHFNVTALLKTNRVSKTLRCHDRSKLILNPRHVEICHVHFIYTLLGDAKLKECCVPQELGFLHHYRGRPQIQMNSTAVNVTGISTDRRMWHYESKIVESLKYVYSILDRELQQVDTLCPIWRFVTLGSTPRSRVQKATGYYFPGSRQPSQRMADGDA
ncbi:hypothetical protein CAPTEDRAFT_186570 [Capitella teleta]|uniref:Glycosyltransferase family 92 protein n=1 Tax=Capitella teleta TaxID=283909 RepID=R7U090_CAPTE|nr:hypothetical protein CAPTEDRAFT_186570 [Capitella teleta]|eukprot:ELT99623.1 hypothetical protein CAPTEDRAFT_186570 [Capitella teleta]